MGVQQSRRLTVITGERVIVELEEPLIGITSFSCVEASTLDEYRELTVRADALVKQKGDIEDKLSIVITRLAYLEGRLFGEEDPDQKAYINSN